MKKIVKGFIGTMIIVALLTVAAVVEKLVFGEISSFFHLYGVSFWTVVMVIAFFILINYVMLVLFIIAASITKDEFFPSKL